MCPFVNFQVWLRLVCRCWSNLIWLLEAWKMIYASDLRTRGLNYPSGFRVFGSRDFVVLQVVSSAGMLLL